MSGWFRFLLLAAVLLAGTLLPGPARAARDEARVFIYHRFGDNRYPSTNIPLETFRAQLQWLQEQHRPVLALSEVLRRLRADEALPAGCVVLTVDDAYRSFLTGGWPLLKRFGFPVTLFVNTRSVGASSYLTWQELRDLAGAGVEIGNHSTTHDYLLERRPGEDAAAWSRRVGTDIAGASRVLAEQLGQPPTLFAYPFGEFSPELEKIVRELGFTAAVAQQSGVVYPGSDRYALPRFPMGGVYASLEGFQEKASMHALPVTVLAPASPVLEDPAEAPVLELKIDQREIRPGGLRCFVQGDNECRVTPLPDDPDGFRVTASKPLVGRRNKYTVTAPGKRGGWYWFSQPWFQPRQPKGGDD